MLEHIPLSNILFLDIETVPQHPSYGEIDPVFKKLWDDKSRKKYVEAIPEETYRQAGIFAEFGKIVCVSCGYFSSERVLRIKSFAGDDERELLYSFAGMLNKFFSKENKMLCAHNGKEFDFPFLARRMVIQNIPLPAVLNTPGKKPWEVNHLDTMELWKFGDYKSYTSLLLLASVLGIPTPKDDIDGSMVWDVYWNEKNLKRIVTYCQKDVLTIAQILLRFRGEELLTENEVEIII